MNEPTTPRNKALENILAGIYVDDKSDSDNLAIVLCAYFEDHIDRPDPDPPDDEVPSWGTWTLKKHHEALRRIASDLLKHRHLWDAELTDGEKN